LLAAVTDVMTTLGFADFVIRLNDRRILTGLIENAGIPASLASDTLVAIDKLDKIGADGVVGELVKRGIEHAAALRCLELFGPAAPNEGAADSGSAAKTSVNDAILAHLERSLVGHESGLAGLNDLNTLLTLAKQTPAGDRVAVDPSLARGLSYYTGAIMEIAVPDLAGSLGGGGRYDNLIGMFLGRGVPACGFSLGLERIIFVMTERKMFPEAVVRPAVDVMVTLWNDESRADAVALAAELRRHGLRVDIYTQAHKIGAQLKYAASRHVPLITLVGDDEQTRHEVKIKDLRTRAEYSVPRGDVAHRVSEILRATGTTSH
jgi:histidyl-tRNA synthetase